MRSCWALDCYGCYGGSLLYFDNGQIEYCVDFHDDNYLINKQLNRDSNLKINNMDVTWLNDKEYNLKYKDDLEYKGKSVNELCKIFNAKAKLLGFDVEAEIEDGMCILRVLSDTFLPEKIPDWIHGITGDFIHVLNKKITLGENVLFLGAHFNQLEEIEFNSNLLLIQDGVFENCKKLKELDLSKTHLTEIGQEAFRSCGQLTDIKFPNTLRCVSDKAFIDCKSLTELEFGENLDYIGKLTHLFCNNLKLVIFDHLPDSIISSNYEIKTFRPYEFEDSNYMIKSELEDYETYQFNSKT